MEFPLPPLPNTITDTNPHKTCEHPVCKHYPYRCSVEWKHETYGHSVPVEYERHIFNMLSRKNKSTITISPKDLDPMNMIYRIRMLLKGTTYLLTFEQDDKERWHAHGVISFASNPLGKQGQLKQYSKDIGLGFLDFGGKPKGPWFAYMFKEYNINRFVMTNQDHSITLKGKVIFDYDILKQ